MGWEKYDEEYDGPAVYRVLLINNFKDKKISRLIGEDAERVLMIGSTSNMKTRKKCFLKAMKNGREKHSEGKFLCQIVKCGLKVEESDLEFCIRRVTSPDDARKEKKTEIWDYIRLFKEPPPLNKAIPKK